MKKIKYIFFDLDGTLLNSQKTVSAVQAAYLRDLRKRKGVHLGIATGRAMTSVRPIAEAAGLLDVLDVAVTNNGAELADMRTGETTKLAQVETAEIAAIVDIFKEYDFINVCFHNPAGFFALRESDRAKGIQRLNHYEHLYSPLVMPYESAARVTLIVPPERFSEARKLIARHEDEIPSDLYGFRSEVDIYDFVRKGTSKAEGIRTYVSRFQDMMDQVMVFGDGENDLEMLGKAGVSVAMKNAAEDVQEASDYVTERTNDEDGILHFLESVENWF